MERPHVLLLGAGASKAALPNGDRLGRPVPVLSDVAVALGLVDLFPESLRELAESNFEAAFSRVSVLDPLAARVVESRVFDYFAALEFPDESNLYDLLQLCLRRKDAIFTFNWDPFLIQSRSRLAMQRTGELPKVFFCTGTSRSGSARRTRTLVF